MATLFAQKAKAPAFMPVDGRGMFLADKIALTDNPAVNAVIALCRIPAGMEVHHVKVQADDLDSNGTPTIAFSLGYEPCDSTSALAANYTYFAPAGQTIAQTGGGQPCNFKPLKFEEDVYLVARIGAQSATFQAGELHGLVNGAAIGPK